MSKDTWALLSATGPTKLSASLLLATILVYAPLPPTASKRDLQVRYARIWQPTGPTRRKQFRGSGCLWATATAHRHSHERQTPAARGPATTADAQRMMASVERVALYLAADGGLRVGRAGGCYVSAAAEQNTKEAHFGTSAPRYHDARYGHRLRAELSLSQFDC